MNNLGQRGRHSPNASSDVASPGGYSGTSSSPHGHSKSNSIDSVGKGALHPRAGTVGPGCADSLRNGVGGSAGEVTMSGRFYETGGMDRVKPGRHLSKAVEHGFNENPPPEQIHASWW